MQVGMPDQKPQLKPRLPLKFTCFEGSYKKDFDVKDLKDYDDIVTTYYDLRDSNRRIDSFTKQITGKNLICMKLIVINCQKNCTSKDCA